MTNQPLPNQPQAPPPITSAPPTPSNPSPQAERNYAITLGGVSIFRNGVFQRILAPACHYTKFSKKNVQGIWRFISRQEFQRVDVEYMTDMAKVFALLKLPDPEHEVGASYGVMIGGNSMYKDGDHRTAINYVINFANLAPNQVAFVLRALDTEAVKKAEAKYRAAMSSLLIQIGDLLAVQKGELSQADINELDAKINSPTQPQPVVVAQ